MSEENKKEEEKESKKESKKEEESKGEKEEEVKKVEKKRAVKKEEKPVPAKEPKAKEKKEVKVPKKFKKLVEEIEQMSVIDLSELVKVLEERFGVSASASTIVTAAPGITAEEDKKENVKSSFDVVITGVGEKKIEVIKALRDITGGGLKDSKDIADKTVHEPQVIKEGTGKEDAEEIKKKLEEAGASVELK